MEGVMEGKRKQEEGDGWIGGWRERKRENE